MVQQSSLARGYCTRTLMALLERERGAEVWDALYMADLVSFLPDENMHLLPLRMWKASEVRIRFDMSPLQVSGSACCWGTVSSDAVDALKQASNKDILNAATSPPDQPMARAKLRL